MSLPALSGPAVLGAPVPGPGARDAIRRELERSEYGRDEPGPLQRVFDWVGRRLDSLSGGGLGNGALIVLLVLVVLVAVAFAVRAGRPARRRKRGHSADEFDPLTPVGSRDHRRSAQALESEGRLADALREWLRAAVATVEERGVLPPRPGRTGSATAREATPALPSAAADLSAAMTAFEQVWFGGRAATADDVALARSAADAVRTAKISGDVARQAIARW